MQFLSEAETRALVSEELAFEAARDAFVAEGRVFPVVVGGTLTEGERFTLKSGSTGRATGVKIGTYWPGSDAHGLPRHSSSTILLDPETGRLAAVLEAGVANAYRTAAADALAADTLARPESATLTIVGTGTQAYYEAKAVARIRPITQVFITGRDLAKAEVLVQRLAEAGLPAAAAPRQEAVEAADIIVTVTTSREPLFDPDWVRPGTHISAMGADGSGKRELPEGVYARGALFCDIPEQSRAIGEFSHAPADAALIPLGAVLRGEVEGRTASDQITVFDSSGFALQDLALAERLLAAHNAR